MYLDSKSSQCFLEIENVNKFFRGHHVLKNISFKVNKGDVIGLLGENGAGKTTLMRVMSGFMTLNSGSVVINGYDLQQEQILAKRRMGYLPESNPLYEEMTINEYLTFIAKLRGLSVKQCVDYLAQISSLFNLDNYWHHSLGKLSKGLRKRVGFAQAIIHNPDVLLFDEPTDGLDPTQKQELRELILTIAKNKVIIISTHILEEVVQSCNRMIILHKGEIKADIFLEDFYEKYESSLLLKLQGESKNILDIVSCLKKIPKIKDSSYSVINDKQNKLQIRIMNKDLLFSIQELSRKVNVDCQLLPPEMSLDLNLFFKERTGEVINLN